MQNDFSLYLGPLLGFLFTAGTLLFVAMNAHRTLPAEPAAEGPAPALETPPAPAESVAPTVEPPAQSESARENG